MEKETNTNPQSTIKAFIRRFREAPPASSSDRGLTPGDFWWLPEKSEEESDVLSSDRIVESTDSDWNDSSDEIKEDFDKKTEELLQKCDLLLQDVLPDYTDLNTKSPENCLDPYDNNNSDACSMSDDDSDKVNDNDDEGEDDYVVLPWVSVDVYNPSPQATSDDTIHMPVQMVNLVYDNISEEGCPNPTSDNGEKLDDCDGRQSHEHGSQTAMISEGNGMTVDISSCVASFETNDLQRSDELFTFLSPSSSVGGLDTSCQQADDKSGLVSAGANNGICNFSESLHITGGASDLNSEYKCERCVHTSAPAATDISHNDSSNLILTGEPSCYINGKYTNQADTAVDQTELLDRVIRSSVHSAASGHTDVISTQAGDEDEVLDCRHSSDNISESNRSRSHASLSCAEVDPFLSDEIVSILWNRLLCVRGEIEQHGTHIT